MGLRQWRQRHGLKDPVRGEFRLTGEYFPHPGRTPMQVMLTGVVTAPGVPATAGEALDDPHHQGRRIGRDVLPALVDRADPSRFIVLWDAIPKSDFGRAQAREQAAAAAPAMQDPAAAPGQAHGQVPASAATPDWVREMIASLPADMVPDGSPVSQPVIIDGGTQVIDLTAGHLSAADAERLSTSGEPATAVLTGITEVPVPQAALPGPTASLCDLSLEVTRSDGRTYSAGTRLGFRNAQRRAAITAPGIVLPVRIDLADQRRVAIDVQAFNAQHPGT